jgi:hypothetical protein
LAWEGNVWPPGEVFGLLKGRVLMPNALFCEGSAARVDLPAWASCARVNW